MEFPVLFETAEASKMRAKPGPNVLFAPGFCINEYFRYHDFVAMASLRAYGATIWYASAYTAALTAYPVFGGAWTSGDLPQLISAEQGYRSVVGKIADIITMEELLPTGSAQQHYESLMEIDPQDVRRVQYRGHNVGHLAFNVVRNMYLVQDSFDYEKLGDEVRKACADCMAYVDYVEALFDRIQPERVFSHDSFYYPWAIFEKAARDRGVRFYSYYTAFRKDTYLYTSGTAAMALDTRRMWDYAKDRVLSAEQREKILALQKQREGGWIYERQQQRSVDLSERERILAFARAKPTAVLYGNVSWDLAALDKDCCFSSLSVAYREIVTFFRKNPAIQLIVKPHPDEDREGVPLTLERLGDIARASIGDGATNILLLQSAAPVTAYDLYPETRCSICHTSSSGIESAWYGTPTLLFGRPHFRGKGFTVDPEGPGEFFGELVRLLSAPERVPNQVSEQALKYWYHLFFTLNVEVGLPSYIAPGPTEDKPVEAFLKNDAWRKVIEGVIGGYELPFLAD